MKRKKLAVVCLPTNLGKSYFSSGKMKLHLHKDSKIKVQILSISQSKPNTGRDIPHIEGLSFEHYLFVTNIT